ncbi:ATP-dependent protease La [Ramicandelaber brevisporus]|nr:ATP-dependent protease La [Ramicandelaber brevisporus]
MLALPIARRPLFPGFYKAVVIRNPAVTAAIKELMRRNQPYVGTFLLKDDESDVDVIDSIDQVHRVGVFAQITGVFPSNNPDDPHSITAVLYPHRRIRLTDLTPPRSTSTASTATVKSLDGDETPHPSQAVEPQTELPSEQTSKGDHSQQTGSSTFGPVAFLERDHEEVSIAHVDNLAEEPYKPHNSMVRAITSEIVSVFKDIAQLNPLFRDQIANFSISQSAGNVFEEPAKLADFAAAVSAGEPIELQEILDSLVIEERLQKALLVLKKELMNAQLQNKISKDVEQKIAKRQREFYLMEQLKGIKKELGIESDGKDKLVESFKEKASKLAMPADIKKVFDEELAKLAHLEPAASEFNVTRNYLDWLTQIPWGKQSKENFELKHAQKVLDEDHYGLQDVKDRILEFIAVGRLRGTVQGKILCLAGPPGVGKTSIGKSIANALHREFYRFSVGGLGDVAEIKGHRRTYVGAMPGKVVQALKKVQTENPLILIDEIDKLGRGNHGDPASALLELLDPEQNSSFLDHYMDVPLNLSKVLFVCTANVLDTIPAPLLDRMEVIQLSGYVSDEKLAIAERYLVPQAKEAAGLKDVNINVTEPALEALIRNYCRESGVRNLKKHIEKIFRKVALKVVRTVDPKDEAVKQAAAAAATEATAAADATEAVDSAVATAEKPRPTPAVVPDSYSLTINADQLKDYVGPPLFTSDRLYESTPPGVVMGLAWTSLGGSSLYIESVVEGISRSATSDQPPLKKTGQLGDVMKESSTIAYTYAKNLLLRYDPTNRFFDVSNIHLHVPEGATPKDGPSAGITMATSLISLALNRPIPSTVAMTGELTLTGKVLKIGGLKEKTIAAKRSGVKTIVFPKSNTPDWEELPEQVKEGIQGCPVDWYEDVLQAIGFPKPPSQATITETASSA